MEHHRAHLASAFYASPFEHAAVLSVNGYCEGSDLSLDGQIYPHSLGA